MFKTIIKLFLFMTLIFGSSQVSAFYHCNLFWKYEGDGPAQYINVTKINYIRVASVSNIDHLYKFSVTSDIIDHGTDLECANSNCYASPATLSAGAVIYNNQAYTHRLDKYPADNGTLRQRMLDKIWDDTHALTCPSAMKAIIQEDLDSGAVSGITTSDWDKYVMCFTRAMDFPSAPANVRLEGEIHWESIWSNSWDIPVSVDCKVDGEERRESTWGWRPSVPTCRDEQLECTRYDPRVPYRWSRKPGEVCIWWKFGDKCSLDIPEEEEIPEPPKENLKYLEVDLKNLYDDYLDKKRDLEEIKRWETTIGRGIIKYPKTLLKTGTPITDRTYIQRNSKVETSLPKNSYQYAWYFKNDINFRTKKLVAEDRNRDLYIVIPTNGLVMPVNTVANHSKDYNTLVSGQAPEVNKYLKTGALLYPGTSSKDFWEVGNKVIFGHSSYWKKDDGRYKTEFQKIMELDKDEEIWIYKKQSNWKYKRYRYKVRIVYPISPKNTYPLEPGVGKNLTLITCTPVWGVKGRWVVSAKYIDENKEDLRKYIYGEDLSFDYKVKIERFLKKLNTYSEEKRKKLILKLYKAILKFEAKGKADKMIEAINYLKLKIARNYFE